jgi:soluble P-type ATPase
MISIEIPGFGKVRLKHLVSDFTGTLSEDGRLVEGVKERLDRISKELKIHILTADTFGHAREELEGVECAIHILTGPDHDVQKEEYVKSIGPENTIALGNGLNDRRMLKAARIGVAVCLKEGCATEAVQSADVLVTSTLDAFGLLTNTKRLKATLRY